MSSYHTEWPLFEVFVKSRNALEHKHSSSLHATDADHALMLARDVYTRRQEGSSLWVVPADCISEAGVTAAEALSTSPCAYEVFLRLKPGLDHKHVGSVDAHDGAEALAKASRAFGVYPPGALWVVAAHNVLATEPEQREPFFEPMADKTYRLPTFYRLPDAVNNM